MFTRTLGQTSAQLLTRLAEKGRTVFSITDAQETLGHNYDATRQTLRRLVRSGWLVRLTAGHYAIVPLSSGNEATPQVNRYVIARELLRETPYYVSHESAMDVHNMLTRPVMTVTITTPRRLTNRTILRVPYRFIHAPAQAIWGHTLTWVTPYEQVTISDLEKTILDGLSRPDLCAGVEQVAIGLWMRHDDLDWEKLANYTKRLDRHVVAQRLGYLLELYSLGTPALIESLQTLVGAAYARLDPILPDDGPYLARWRLRLNLEPEALQTIIRT